MKDYKLEQRLRYSPNPTVSVSEKEVEDMIKQLEQEGHTGSRSMTDFVKDFKKNLNKIFFCDGPISFNDFMNRVENEDYNE